MKLRLVASVLALVAGTVSAADAATATFGALPTFVGINPVADVKTGIVREKLVGNRPRFRSPWFEGDDEPDVGVIYTAPDAYYTGVREKSSATYVVDRSIGVSFAWGSPDTYNLVEFLRGGNVVDSFAITTATSILPGSKGDNSAGVRIGGIAGGWFDALRLSSSSFAFEYANLTFEYANLRVAPVPLPAAGLMLVSAMGGTFLLRKKRQAA